MEQGYIEEIAREINTRSRKGFRIGNLQAIRKEIRGLKRPGSNDIFASKSIFDKYAFHSGGRDELQFNVGLEELDRGDEIRFGIAFSLETSRYVHSIDVLIPKVELFNDYLRNDSGELADMRMWHYQQSRRSTDYMPSPIPSELAVKGVFVFLGVMQEMGSIDIDAALAAMDRLLPLYLYVQTGGKTEVPGYQAEPWEFVFRPGCPAKPSTANASFARRRLDVQLRHNDMQRSLYRRLSGEFGTKNVGTELSSGSGTSVDLVVRHSSGYWFYEIKTAHTAKACIRQAIGQLLEYSYWPNNQEASRLVIVGEPAIDEEASLYIETLRAKFSIPIGYESIKI